ncbi:DEKNAAC102886 [Brettanomyces naardenensis]|uniref:DEKNAAC102886 n=1 Tax=Brettanomyces naardenensis TaxID=13370 RepID=A0A448YLW8_BRENA|nr:DEKNAAC102886 [Brettanomyces naardenensis]
MNLALLDPFAVASDFPETLTETLSYGYSSAVKFNQKGDYLASGLGDGTIVIIDVETNNTIMVLRDHVRAITSLCWSSSGRYLLSSSRDWKVNLWDLKTGKVVRFAVFSSPIWNCVMIPDHVYQFAAAVVDDEAVFVDMEDESDIKITQLSPDPVESVEGSSEGNEEREASVPATGNKRKRLKKHVTLTCAVSIDGRYVFAGTNRGWVNVIYTDTLKTIGSLKVCDSNIKSIEIAPTGERMIVNSGDKTLRQYSVSSDYREFELEQKYQDVVNKIQYNSVKFSHDSEYMCASTLGSTHDIYIWETKMGSLVKILEGSKEELIEVDWNYRRCSIVATGMDSGMIYWWSVVVPQKWSNLAPDFEEIEENIDYEEKEDEFDMIDSDRDSDRMDAKEQSEVDVVTREEKDARGFPFIDSFVIDSVLTETDGA